MKKLLIAGLSVLAVNTVGTVNAADWNGPYVGANAGYGWGNADTKFEPLPSAAIFVNLAPTTLDPSPSGALLGGLLGYNWRFGNFVTGAEADISWSGIRGSKTQSPIIQNNGTPFPGAGLIKASEDIDWFGTVRGRLGIVPVDKWLIFATGGLAFANVKYSATTDFRPVGTEQYPASVHKTKTGWTLGLGTEWAAQSNLSVKFEYLYYDLGHESELASPQPPLPPFAVKYKWQTTGNIVRFGLNYSF